MALPLLRPDWPVPPGVGAAMSLREGGVSSGPWRSLNLGVAVGDAAAHVAANRARLAEALGARPVWLRQVHGVHVLRLTAGHPGRPDGGARPETAAEVPTEAPADATTETPADAAWTDEPGLACTVQVADCLPVLLARRDGRAVAAAHAGWRGLAGGVLEATVAALCRGTGATPCELQAWLGPCIGPRQFEVGAEVLQAYGRAPGAADQPAFRFRVRPDGSPRWLADLQQLAHERLVRAGVGAITCCARCTVEDSSAFFSFRRDGVTGRMAAAIWRQ